MAAPEKDLQEFVDAPLLLHRRKPLENQSALITGATRMNGIGFAIAERFALEGASPIILVGTERSQDVAPFSVARLKRYGVEAHSLIGDVSDEASCVEMMTKAYDLCNGDVSILVNNAGTNKNQALTDITEEDWDFIMGPKVKGALFMTREWFRIRNEANIKGGKEIIITSVVGLEGNTGQDLYSMANAAVVGLIHTRARAYGDRGITINGIAPGFVPGTEMTSGIPESQLEVLKASAALGQLVRLEDIAGAAAYLAGPDGDRVTGTVMVVDSGLKGAFPALAGLHKAGVRLVPRPAWSIIEGFTTAEAALIRQNRAQGDNK